jgi:precorrin-6B methylase 2
MRIPKKASREGWISTLGALVLAGLVSLPMSLGATVVIQGTDFDSLENRLFKAYRAGFYEQALEIALRMHELRPNDADTILNIASLYKLNGSQRQAYEWFEKSVDEGGLRSERMKRLDNYIATLERKERAAFQKPEEVMGSLALKLGEKVADIGAGSGYFTVPIAKAVGPKGAVWAVDIEQRMLDHIEVKLRPEGLENVRLILARKDDPLLPKGKVDTVLMVDTLHYIERRSEYAKKLVESLAPNGRIVIIDYIPKPWKERPWGPLPQQQISRTSVDEAMAEAGLEVRAVHDFLPEQYFVEYQLKR